MKGYIFCFRDRLDGRYLPLFEIRSDSKLTACYIVSRDIRKTWDSLPHPEDLECHVVGEFDPVTGDYTGLNTHDIYSLDKERGLAFVEVV